MNDRAALELLLEHGPLSRTRIGSLTGLSKPTASQLLARLEAAGLVVATGTAGGRSGPRAQLYALHAGAAYVAGLDVTPGRITAAVADLTGRIVGRGELSVPVAATAPASGTAPASRTAAVVGQVTEALDRAAAAAGLDRSAVRRLVVGTPGAFDPRTGRLRYADHLPGWHSPALPEELAAALPMPVAYENDVNLAAVAEQRLGAARGHRDFVLLWNETGLGAALVLGGRLHRGWTGGAGEVGFLPVPGRPPVRGVRALNAGGYQELAGVEAVSVLAAGLGIAPTPGGGPGADDPVAVAVSLLSRAAARPEGPHLELLRRHATALATGLASLVCVLDPEIVVLSGAVNAAGGEVLRALTAAELAELAPSSPRLILSGVPGQPVLRGALETALAVTRDEVFDTSRSPSPGPSPGPGPSP
ncbi:ROK family transcriptional regulator [Streptomyces sp. NPDC089799]|uniref:ROK family transcriptional regulator n=1 Tax=Streptomyces sp. NPDC089799 TaxID=3155066 RepID=UPI00344257F8